MAEAFDAWRKGRDNLGEELAYVAIYLLGLTEMTGIDIAWQLADDRHAQRRGVRPDTGRGGR